MSFLAPLYLLAALAVAIPLALHLRPRIREERIAFPALRYLLRTEREHATEIRLRQWLLLALRCAVVLLLAAAAARTVAGSGAAHPPTALAIVLDNSLSSQRITGDVRVLDELRERALETVRRAGDQDRIHLILPGSPWEVAPPVSPAEAEARIAAVEPTDVRGDLSAALRRADGLLRDSGLGPREIHLISDLQRSGFDAAPRPVDAPIIAWAGTAAPESNRYIRSVEVGGGLTPRAGRRAEFAITAGAASNDTVAAPVRLFLDGTLRGAADARAQSTVLLPAGPFPAGELVGRVETDPDGLRADDRRWVVTRVAPPPSVALAGDPGDFVREAVAVLEETGRLTTAPASAADVLLSVGGEGPLSTILGRGGRIVVLPPTDPALRTATNERLASAGVPLSLGALSPGTRTGAGPVGIDSLRLDRAWAVEGTGTSRLDREDGPSWWREAPAGEGSAVLVGSPLTLEASEIPLSTAMIPLLEALLDGGRSGPSRTIEAGDPIPLTVSITEVETPSGERVAVDPSRRFERTAEAGIYRLLDELGAATSVAVNPPLAESRLDAATPEELAAWSREGVRRVDDADGWRDTVFLAREGQELWRPLLVATLLLLLAESRVASAGGVTVRSSRPSPTRARAETP